MKFYTSVEQAGDTILVRGYNEGRPYQDRVKFNPTLFLPSPLKSEWRTLDGKYVRPVKQGTIRDAKQFVQDHKDIPDFDICGQTRYVNQYINEEYPNESMSYDMGDIRVFTLDIETQAENGFPDIESADQEILLISIKDSNTNIISVFGTKPYDHDTKDGVHGDVKYMHFSSESAMLNAFVHWWSSNYPDVITGWNVQLFDMPYIIRRINRVVGEKESRLISPWKNVYCREFILKVVSRLLMTFLVLQY